MFHVRRRPADYHPRKRKKKPQHKWSQHPSGSNELLEYRYEDGLDRLPLLLELNPDGSEICGGAAKRHRLHPNVTEVGCERNTSQTQSQYLQLFGPNILPRHCVIANTEGIVTVTPCSRDSETYVNGQRIYETTILRNGAIVKFGRIHCYRFLDPYFEERIRQRHDSLRNIHEYAYDRQSTKEETSSQTTLSMDRKSPPRNNACQPQQNIIDPMASQNFETTFDVDGNIETRSTSSQGNNKEDSRSQRSVGSGSKDGNRIPGSGSYQRAGTDAILPAVLEIREETEEALLNEIITSLDPNIPSFKLAPAYCLYLMARYRASTHYRPELTPTERAHRLTLMLARVATLIQNVIQEHYCDIRSLALWLANSSELLFFLQFDRHLFAFSKDARRILSDSVQISFRHLVGCVQSELSAVMPHFFADKDDTSHESEDSPTVLGVLASAMALLRRYRVNVALTVQLFSHLFHFINVWAFNRLIAPNTNYCSRLWGLRLKARLAQIEAWAERQGLEISTDTHLARIVQAAHLLQAPKYTGEDLASLSSTCFLLNSLQLRTLLLKYQPASDEPTLPRELIENVVRVAENLADELARSDGREVKLEEDPEFALEFVLPIDSYSCEVVRGIPPGLIEFVSPLQSMGLCRLSTQPTSNGLWTVYMELPNAKGAMMRSPSAMSNRSVGYLPGPQEPEINVIKLHKSNNGMGLSIVAAKGAGQDKLGIYIKAVVKGGAADADGRLQAGDQLLKVDGQSLVGITQEKAAEYLVRTGPIVTLEVAKQGAIYHGLATLLSQPSPVMTREKPRPRSELFAEPIREVLPSSYSMINLHQNNHAAEPDNNVAHWEDRVTGVTGDDSGCKSGGGGSVGKHLMKLPRRNSFQPRYGNFLHPDYALLYPSNVCHEEPCASEEEEEEEDSRPVPRGVLTASDSANRMAAATPACSYPPPMQTENKLCLCEDVLQAKEAPKRSSLEWKCRARMSPRRSFSDAKPTTSLTRRLVSDVTSCCLGVVPESDASTCVDDELSCRRKDKSVMTDESSFRRGYSVDGGGEAKVRNSCPLEPPRNELCECEKSIRSGSEPATKVLYENGNEGRTMDVLPASTSLTAVEPIKSSVSAQTICDIVTLNDQYHQNNVKRLLSNFRSLGDVATVREIDVSRRSSSDGSLYQRSSLIAECTKCGNKFDIRDKYFGRAVVENVTTTTTSNSSTSGSQATGTSSTTSSDRESTAEQYDKDRKLTKEEREDILRELEDIISGNFFGDVGTKTKKNATGSGVGGASSFPSSMLHLDLNTLKDSDTSASEGSLHMSNYSSVGDSNDFRTGRVAELARHFSKLGEAGIIRAVTDTKTKSVPNLPRYLYDPQPKRYQRSSSMEQLNRKEGVVLTELEDNEPAAPSNGTSEERRTSADEGHTQLDKRRQSFARQNTVFCKMKSVDELDLKRQHKPRKLYKYASLADFRTCNATKTEDKKKVVSFDDLSLRRNRDPATTPDESRKPAEKKEFNLESFLLKNKPHEENLKINYDKMTTAIRDYLANKELLLKRMKSNSIEQFGAKSCSLSNLNRACPNFTTIREAVDGTAVKADLKTGTSVDALYSADTGDRPGPEVENEDEFNFKHNLRRVYKGSYFKGRRFRRCRKLDSRRSFLIYPGENLNRFRLSDEMKRETFDRYRCQSLDTGMEAVPSRDDDLQRSRGRRMSERDLPSRISNEQANQATQLPMHTPLIHSSKSVPSLNSPGVNEGQVVSPVASRSSHEVFNSSYNCTPSSNNISMQHPALRSRSSQNLNDSRSLNNYPQNVTPNLPNRQPSNPNLLQNNVPSPHYQYYHQLPQQQHPMYHQHVQQQQMLLHQQQQQQYQYNTPPNHVEGERFYQNLNVYRNHDMPNGVITNGTGSSATMMKGKVLSPQQPDRSSNQFQRSFRGSQTSLQQQPQGRQSVEILPSYMKERPSSAYLQKENYPPPQNTPLSGRSQSTRDIIRQEAKLQEMTEEVRRREMRSNFSPPQHYPISPSRVQSPGEAPEPVNQQYMHHKQGQMMYDGQPARPPYPSHKIGTMRPSIEEMGYRESPPPPPPPPTSTHPLYQSNIQRSLDDSTLTSQAPQQRLDSLLEQTNAPPPPERGSSFVVMSQALRSPVGTPSQTRNDVSQNNNTTPKKVSFQDSTPESNASGTPGEKIVVDLNRFINEAESMLGSPKSPDTQFLDSPQSPLGTQEVYKYVGATPGVIGTQEVYKDPRQRRLAEQQHQKLLSSKVVPVPEKLTFKEKMKMFAMETGEEGTPKDKVKISRAQRDIDNLNSPSATNANNANKNTVNHDNIDNRIK